MTLSNIIGNLLGRTDDTGPNSGTQQHRGLSTDGWMYGTGEVATNGVPSQTSYFIYPDQLSEENYRELRENLRSDGIVSASLSRAAASSVQAIGGGPGRPGPINNPGRPDPHMESIIRENRRMRKELEKLKGNNLVKEVRGEKPTRRIDI